MAGWTVSDIPHERGRFAVVTGTGGLGLETALGLAFGGYEVVLAGRNATKGAASVARVRAAIRSASIRFELLDLASLASVASFCGRLRRARDRVDLLVNNAGVMAPPTRQTTADGFELQFGTNYLGHFALTAGLLPLLIEGIKPRVISLSSVAHRRGAIRFDDLQSEQSYRPWRAYSQSKLAMLMFALELQRRSDANGWELISNAAHPGFARTELMANGPGTGKGLFSRGQMMLGGLAQSFVGQTAAEGALPILYAATAPEALGGAYYGPDGFLELKGAPAPAEIMPQALDLGAAARLWAVSEQLTGESMPARALPVMP